MNQYVERNGEVFCVLLQEDAGVWLISCQAPAEPFFVAQIEAFNPLEASSLTEALCPHEALSPHEAESLMSPGQAKRLRLIQPLLDDSRCITDKAYRSALAKETAGGNGTTSRRILRLYYRYLATGKLMQERRREPSENKVYDWAIRTFYFSAKKLSLRAAYEMMLVQKYTDAKGILLPDAPTWSSFQHYFYAHNYHKQPQKIIARDGLSHYQRNCRPAFGSASRWRESPGSYQMDATQGDLYLVSSLDRSSVVGRPQIYMAVDSATQLIAGIYVGYEGGERAVMACLENAASGKVDFCRKYGIEIQPEQWPSQGLPSEIITDKGREFTGSRMEELCRRYGVELLIQPPFRPDGKGLVEKAFDLLQQRYKPLLRGKGVIEPDAQERWAVDYRSQAVLTLEEFTQIVIQCVIYLNSGRVLQSGRTPAQVWLKAMRWLSATGSATSSATSSATGSATTSATVWKVQDVPSKELHVLSLPREEVKLTRKGFRLHALSYVPQNMDGLYLGDTYTLAYDPLDLSAVFLIAKDHDSRIPLAPDQQQYQGLSQAEAEICREQERQARKQAKAAETQASIQTIQGIQKIVKEAERRRQE